MGCSPFKKSSSCSSNSCSPSSSSATGNPNPKNYSIKDVYETGNNLVVKINYPDCTNYEGNKILVYKGVKLKDIVLQNSIDPHFCDNNHLSPFARFEPTTAGWSAAKRLAEIL